MNILYVLGNGSKWGDNELRYSLRSIAKFGRGVGNVFLCGLKPRFVSDKVRYCHNDPRLGSASKNIAANIDKAIEVFGDELGEDFLVSSDDHFYVRETDFEHYPFYIKGELPRFDPEKNYAQEKYARTLVDTRIVLERMGRPTRYFAHHANYHIIQRVWNKYREERELSRQMEQGVESNSFMYNLLEGVEFTPRKDCKISYAPTRKDLLEQIGEREVFSIYDSAIPSVEQYLREMFKTPCIYEK